MADKSVAVVPHFIDGRILKGITNDFYPTRPCFHVVPKSGHGLYVRISDLKAVFFVRNLDGDSERGDLKGFIAAPRDSQRGRKLAVRFRDSELICGYSLGYAPHRQGFFMFPADTGSNNLRVYVITAAAAEIREGPAADELAQRILNSRAA